MTNKDWLYNALIDGWTRLAVLGLTGQPAAELLTAGVQVWFDAIQSQFTDIDETQRIKATFDALIPTLDRWPTVKQFLSALPPRHLKGIEQQLPNLSPQQIAKNKLRIKNILNNLTSSMTKRA